MIASFLALSILLLIASSAKAHCDHNATITIVETIPVEVNLTTKVETFDAWLSLIDNAKNTIDIAAFYVRLLGGDQYPAKDKGDRGKRIFDALIAAVKRNVTVRLVESAPADGFPDNDSRALAAAGVQVRNLNMSELVHPYGGILHTKLIIVDGVNSYLGSANMDWASLAQVKELGIVIQNCGTAVQSAAKVFDQYWIAANLTSLPASWPSADRAIYNATRPMIEKITSNGYKEKMSLFLSVSPPEFVTEDRTGDIDALVAAINEAQKTVSLEVMDYSPASTYFPNNFYWPVLDDALRNASFRGVRVRLMFGKWEHTPSNMPQYWRSLNELEHIEVREFIVPPLKNQKPIPFTRVNHAKYIVTEKRVFISTSNFTPGYFIHTCGLSWNIGDAANFRGDMQSRFDRDWYSTYTNPV